MVIKLEIKGLDKVKKLLEELKAAAKRPHVAMDLVGQRMVVMQKRHFRNQEGPDGQAWEPLKLATIARRRAGRGSRSYRTKGRRIGMGAARAIVHFGGAVPVAGISGVKILQDTGMMYRSLTYAVATDGLSAEAGIPTAVPYGATHQYGDRKRNIPARPFCYLNRQETQQLVNLLKKELLKILNP